MARIMEEVDKLIKDSVIHHKDKRMWGDVYAKEKSLERNPDGIGYVWKLLSQDKLICSIVVTCPPAADEGIMYQNEVSLRELIARISFAVYDEILDVYTSRKEIGIVTSCTQVYVRPPICFDSQAQNTATDRKGVV